MKQVLITGASSGIGAATAQIFSERGWKVHLVGRSLDKLSAVQKTLHSPSEIYAFDLSDQAQVDRLAQELLARGANLQALVNNAGIYKALPFDKEDASNWNWHFATNLFAPVRLTRLFWSQLIQNKGSVTNVSSTLGLRPIPNTGAYSASKAALDNWTMTLALEGGPHGVRANAVSPGLVDTPIHGFHKSQDPKLTQVRAQLNSLQPLGRVGEPEDIAKAVYFLASDQATWVTGAILPVDGGVTLTTHDPFHGK